MELVGSGAGEEWMELVGVELVDRSGVGGEE